MKKILTLALALTLALSLAACGGTSNSGGSGGSTTPPANNTPSEKPADNPPADTSTVAGYLGAWGLSEADIKPAEATEVTMQDGVLAIKVPESLTTDQIKVFLDQLFAAIRGISEDGEIKNDKMTAITTDDEELNTLMVRTWFFKYNGSNYNSITVSNLLETKVWTIKLSKN
jgi:hypothetical protein